jgi:aminoglycoside phosphotransferase (APT) family kinase protein
MSDQPEFRDALCEALRKHIDGAQDIGALKRLSGGASQETWAFELITQDAGPVPLILRRAPGGGGQAGTAGTGTAIGLANEAKVIEAARANGVAAPAVEYVLKPEDGVGDGYVMARISGETLARRILRDKEFDAVRPKLAFQCGEAMAGIHKTDVAGIDTLKLVDGPTQLAQYYDRYKSYDQPKPVFELAFALLRERLKAPREVTLVHADFRNGNIMIHPETGLAAVLDWELAHLGDPLEDLSWICINSWRFGMSGKTVGGFGSVEELLAGYRAAGGAPYTAEEVKVWEIFGSLKWGIMCMSMYESFRTGYDRSVERAAIGRRSSETEIDLVNLLLG